MSLYGGVSLPGAPDLSNLEKLDRLPIPMTRRMTRAGIAIDIPYFNDLTRRLELEMDNLRADIACEIPPERLGEFLDKSADIDDWCPINIESGAQIATLLFDMLDIGRGKELKRTKGGDRLSTGKKQLEILKKEHPVIGLLLQYRERSKLVNTYTSKLPKIAKFHPRGPCCPVCELSHPSDSWRIHTELVTTRTDTGRLACVAPWTPVRTPVGSTPIKDLQIGDFVWTHKQRWRKVTAKWIKGVEQMYNVTFSNGEVLTCTGSHRLLLYSHEHIENMDKGTGECGTGFTLIPPPGLPDCRTGSIRRGYDISHGALGTQPSNEQSGVQSTQQDSVLPLQDGRKESDVRENGEPTPQLDRSGGRWVRVSDLFEGWQTAIRTSDSNGRSSGAIGTTRYFSCTSYRFGYQEQQFGQSGLGDCDWSQRNPLPTDSDRPCFIQTINHTGSHEVHDITVDEDESYLACGVFSHNSRSPNLQNIPAKTLLGRLVREGFIATPGHVLISCDYAQIELRLLAHCAADFIMQDIFRRGGDIHIETAIHAFGFTDPSQVDKLLHRAPCKNLNFGIVYGLTEKGLYDQMALTYATAGKEMPDYITEEWCKQFIQSWFGVYRHVEPYMDLQYYRARRYEMIWCQLGRIRRVPEVRSCLSWVRSAGLRQSGNMPIQSLAAGVMKIGMARTQDNILTPLHSDGVWCWPLLPIHDELIIESEPDYAEYILDRVVEEFSLSMTDTQTGRNLCSVPIGADGKTMERWIKE